VLAEVPLDIGLEAVEPYGRRPDQVEQRVQQCHARHPEAAEETEPGPCGIGCRRHAAQQETALHPASARAEHHIEPGTLPEVPASVHHQVLFSARGDREGAEVADQPRHFDLQVASHLPHQLGWGVDGPLGRRLLCQLTALIVAGRRPMSSGVRRLLAACGSAVPGRRRGQ
jgi:hypothetical protein